MGVRQSDPRGRRSGDPILARAAPRPRSVEAPLRCALCHDALDGAIGTCPSCDTSLHEDCWTGRDRCPTLGCPVVPAAVAVRRRGLHASVAGLLAVVLVGLGAIAVIAALVLAVLFL